jgi:hypothetical protein
MRWVSSERRHRLSSSQRASGNEMSNSFAPMALAADFETGSMLKIGLTDHLEGPRDQPSSQIFSVIIENS